MFSTQQTSDPERDAVAIRRWRCARIVMRDGRLEAIRKRRTVGSVSVAEVWLRTRFTRPQGDVCSIDYHQPLGMPAFLTLDFIHSGVGTRAKTFLGACRVLDEVARIRGTLAIVAHVTNTSISDRLLQRMGWTRHQPNWSGRHWIRRFYDGYPESTLARYRHLA